MPEDSSTEIRSYKPLRSVLTSLDTRASVHKMRIRSQKKACAEKE